MIDRAKSIALIGARGCGKTTVGRILANLLGGECVDTDALVADGAGRSIAEVFATEGEAGFRKRESQAVREVLEKLPAVMSVGGGAVLHQENVDALRAVAVLVWLTAPAEVLWQRISTDPATASSRPLLTDQSGFEEVRQLLEERTPLYQRAAEFRIETVDRDPKEIAEEIARRVLPPGVMDGRTNAQGRRC